MKQITDKTYVLIARDGIRIWLTEQQGKDAVRALNRETPQFLIISGDKPQSVKKTMVIYCGPREQVEVGDRIKRGDYQCSYGEWHTKGQQCAHGSAYRP